MPQLKPSVHDTGEKTGRSFSLLNIITKSSKDQSSSYAPINLELANIKCADPYSNDPYDRVVQARHVLQTICNELIELGVYSQRELNVVFTEEARNAIIERVTIHPALADTGIYNDFDFSKQCALRISKETKKLVETFQPDILECSVNNIRRSSFVFLNHHFYTLRHVYINLGKLHALLIYFNKEHHPSKDASKSGMRPSSNQYIPETKEILLILLRDQAKIRNGKFKTIPAATKSIAIEFEKQYETLQGKSKYKTSQNFFAMDNLVANIRRWTRTDPAFKEALFEFIS